MGYWVYYLALMFLSYALARPWVMLLAVIFFVLRPVLPDPWVLLSTARRMRALKSQVTLNPSNVTARRDLARIYIDRLQPGAALRLLDEARGRHPEDPELLFLTGLARLRSGDAEGGLEPLERAMELDPRLHYGEPHRVAAEALVKLGRLEEAEDALDRFVGINSSSVEGYTRLAMVRHARGDKAGASAATREALQTFAQIPNYLRRKQFGWWLRAQITRITTETARTGRS
jgi:predicted Zn-dependent protease